MDHVAISSADRVKLGRLLPRSNATAAGQRNPSEKWAHANRRETYNIDDILVGRRPNEKGQRGVADILILGIGIGIDDLDLDVRRATDDDDDEMRC